jgi:hypothetical protein
MNNAATSTKFFLIVIVLALTLSSCSSQVTSTLPTLTPAVSRPQPTASSQPPTASNPPPTLTPDPTLKCAAIVNRPLITVDQSIGVNSFNDVPNEVNAVAGILREYHNWVWDEEIEGQNKWNPSYAGNYWDFDTWYTGLKTNDPPILVSPVIQNNLTGNPYKPTDGSTTDPLAYTAHASHLYQYAARYGSVAVPDTNLKLATDQPRLTGLNLIQYYEDWNEPDKWWEGNLSNFSPEEYAAMASADYDGHCQKMGQTFGVRNADPDARLVMGGIATGLDLYYLQGIKVWADTHRNGQLPFDVINFHHYSTTGKKGISPEADQLKEKLQKIVAWRDTNAPDMEIWYSEFGWDTHPASPQAAQEIQPFSIYQVQGQWIVRTYLAALAAGIDRAFQFDIRDGHPTSGTQYATSGLTWYCDAWSGCRDMPDHQNYDPKPSWYYLYTLKNQLTGMLFNDEQDSGNANVLIYTFKGATFGGGAYVLWSPTSNNTTVNDYQLKLRGYPASATLVTLSDTSTTGDSSPLTISEGTVTVNVSERPIFVLVSSLP